MTNDMQQTQHIHKVLSSLAQGNPVDLVKGIVIGYDGNGNLRWYNADMTTEEIVVACELTKAKTLGLLAANEVPHAVARQMAARDQKAQASNE
ncbi:hypothetical protein [Pseudoalteromonas umbrosa]|uniref:hypothetical protein n=1 Tax=Pseudoalteromonas umbrosa TaxID=3048489 RepID=UPI0024C3596C|nr:hypothetical protein [Pseudoalteromonas sp. B95]MDK1290123.1 hypothetical protein [Pseudoalteromonas sp. B95]